MVVKGFVGLGNVSSSELHRDKAMISVARLLTYIYGMDSMFGTLFHLEVNCGQCDLALFQHVRLSESFHSFRPRQSRW